MVANFAILLESLSFTTGFRYVGMSGTSLPMVRWDHPASASRPSRKFLAYTVFTILSFLLTLSALAYTFAVSNQTKGQTIDKTIAGLVQGPAYPKDQWTRGT